MGALLFEERIPELSASEMLTTRRRMQAGEHKPRRLGEGKIGLRGGGGGSWEPPEGGGGGLAMGLL